MKRRTGCSNPALGLCPCLRRQTDASFEHEEDFLRGMLKPLQLRVVVAREGEEENPGKRVRLVERADLVQ